MLPINQKNKNDSKLSNSPKYDFKNSAVDCGSGGSANVSLQFLIVHAYVYQYTREEPWNPHMKAVTIRL